MWLIKNSPVWDEPNEGGGAAPAADTSATMYPDDQAPAAETAAPSDVETPTEETPAATDKPVVAPPADADAGDWKEYVDDPAKTPEENAAAKRENDLQHPVNQVPEDGKYDFKLPEGVELDQGLVDALGPTFKELNLSRGHAQMLADKFTEAMQAKATQQTEAWGQTVSGWADKAKADPDIGGAKWDSTLASAKSAVTRFGSPELVEYLEASGAGNHPEVIRLMAKVGSMIAEDKPAISESPGGAGERDAAATLYPNDTPKGK